ncbi:hypothetical protein PV08_02872 [Exophiala spinifera]|uniref:Putative lipoate-protein ligase A n=1 Tax=Exophiala spinifera TaxID=91928 RepID=A0A0D2C4S7_9EURO|nr:uncharacterized protein PV08_02872 [Exophiala spinifera]KIW18584.1 hypothetical protein PV08_02872 [Exophiala spinifera]
MRTASTRALTKSRCLLPQPHTPVSQRRSRVRQRFDLSAASRRITTSSAPAWSLRDLPGVSEETSPLICHLTSDNPYHNLSIEHYFLTHSHPESHILLFYTNRPCVVIGRNQNPWLETDLNSLRRGLAPELEQEQATGSIDKGKSRNGQLHGQAKLEDQQNGIGDGNSTPVDLVRRRSGGGTVFHDSGNLNYSVIVPNSKSFKRSTHAEMVVRALSPAAASYGFGAIRVNDRNDIVMQEQQQQQQHRRTGAAPEPAESRWLKVSGSAYKLTRGRALHHGTLLYSSPYIHRISELLRSPGRDFITAKGVESVRSPVGNLVCAADGQWTRESVREDITRRIAREFWRMYGADRTRAAGINEITLGSEQCVVGADGDPPSEIANGVRELMSNAWRFEQTPRFDFASGMLDGAEVFLTANRAVLERLAVRKLGEEQLVEWAKADFGREIKLHDLRSWQSLIGGSGRQTGKIDDDEGPRVEEGVGVGVSDALVKRVGAVFPQWPAVDC